MYLLLFSCETPVTDLMDWMCIDSVRIHAPKRPTKFCFEKKNKFQDKLADFLGCCTVKRCSASGGFAPDQGLCPPRPPLHVRAACSPCGPSQILSLNPPLE